MSWKAQERKWESQMPTPGQLTNPEVRDQNKCKQTASTNKKRHEEEARTRDKLEWMAPVSVCRVSRSVSHHVPSSFFLCSPPQIIVCFSKSLNSPEHMFVRMVLFG